MIPETFTPEEITTLVEKINAAKSQMNDAITIDEHGVSVIIEDLHREHERFMESLPLNKNHPIVQQQQAGFNALPALKDKKIVYVDDSLDFVRSGIQNILVATRANAIGIVPTYKDSLADIVTRILLEVPDMVLLDKKLTERGFDYSGIDIAKALQAAGFKGVIIGASSGTEEFDPLGITNVGKPSLMSDVICIAAEYHTRLITTVDQA